MLLLLLLPLLLSLFPLPRPLLPLPLPPLHLPLLSCRGISARSGAITGACEPCGSGTEVEIARAGGRSRAGRAYMYI